MNFIAVSHTPVRSLRSQLLAFSPFSPSVSLALSLAPSVVSAQAQRHTSSEADRRNTVAAWREGGYLALNNTGTQTI